ncbi:GFA family protein [Roseomonas aeriglobus]|nr:GFA family protein [Roseomonas aeriglobus]
MAITGGCQCGAIRYTAEGQPHHNALCCCADCRKSAGATPVGWALFDQDKVTIVGTPISYNSSAESIRQFCGTCGTGLFFYSATVFPGQVDIQSATFDDPDAVPPVVLIQTAEAPRWLETIHDLPKFARFPGMGG